MTTRKGYLIGLVCVLFLAACSGQQATQAASARASTGTQRSTTSSQFQITTEMRLALGTFLLEKTENAVTAKEAGELLPLWKAVKSLTSSDTASTLEIQALYDQIQETMTSAQVQYIQQTEMTAETMRTVMQDAGVELGQTGPTNSSGGQSNGSSSGRSSSGPSFRQDGGPEGGPGGFGGPPPDAIMVGGPEGGTNRTTASSGANGSSSTGATANFGGMMMTRLLDPLITLLKTRAGQ